MTDAKSEESTQKFDPRTYTVRQQPPPFHPLKDLRSIWTTWKQMRQDDEEELKQAKVQPPDKLAL
jgi:hypothetical protein